MSDDLNKKIKQLTDILGQDSLPDNLKGLLSLLGSSSGKQESSPDAEAAQHTLPAKREERSSKEERSGKSDLEDNIEMIRKVKTVMDKMNSNHDPRVSLLTAIKPFLNNKRQKKLNDCIKLLQMASLTKFLDDNDKANF